MINFFRETQNNHFLSGMVVFGCYKGEIMRYFIIFGVTFILLLFILFYNPYLGVFKDSVTIEYDYHEEGYSWDYEIDKDCLKISSEEENKWVFIPNKNCTCNLLYRYNNGEEVMYEIAYEFKVKGNKIYWLTGSGNGLLSYPNPY